MARLRYLSNARTGDAGTVCTGDLTVTGDIVVAGSYTYGSGSLPINQNLQGTFTVGVSGSGYDVKFWGDTGGKYWLWDASADGVVLAGSMSITGAVAIDGDITMATDDQINFYDTGAYIQGSTSGVLALTATTIALSGAITSTGKTTITPAATGTFIDFVLDAWGYGTLINADFGVAETLTDDSIGILLDFNGNVTMTTDKDVEAIQIKLPALTQTANDTVITGFDLPTAGTITNTTGSITWKGVNLQLPTTVQTSGTTVAYGMYVTSGTLTSGTQIGVYVSGTLTDGFKMHATATDGIEISGDCTNFINFNNVADTSAVALHFVSAFLGHSIETGTYQSTADGGVILDSTNTFNAAFLADDSGSDIVASVRNLLARTLLTTTQSGGSIRSIMGQLKILDNIDVGTGVYTAVQGYVELAGDTDVATGGKMSCIDISLEVASAKTFTIDSGGLFAGLKIETTGAGTITNNGTCCAIYIDDGGTVTDWPVGVDINNCTVGIDIGAATTGINISGTYAAATSRAIKSAITINNCNLTDGYGTNEFDLTITGTGAGHIAATSSWLNIGSGTHGAGGNFLTPLTVGVYEAGAATITGATLIFGMRMQAILGDTDVARLCPLDINVSGDTIDAIWNAPAPTHLGYAADSTTDSTKCGDIPFFIDSNGSVKYIRIYDAAS